MYKTQHESSCSGGKVATSPLPPRGSPPLQSGGQNQKWPIHGQGGYITPAASGIPSASERGVKSEVAHTWERGLHHPCRLGDLHRFTAGGEIRSGPYMGKVATSPLPPQGSPALQSGGQNQESAHECTRWLHHPCRLGDPLRFTAGSKIRSRPTSGQGGYITPAASGIPTASKRVVKAEVAHTWAGWLHHPCRLGDPHRFRAGGKIGSGP